MNQPSTPSSGSSRIVVANAPVSYGAFELTVGILPEVPEPETVLDAVADAGYAGIDLGPPGYLGQGDVLIFPSFIMHRALPVRSGTRWTLVSWLTGPQSLK